MGMMDTVAVSASGMTAERLRMDVIANNLANVNTTRAAGGGPFRRQQVILSPLGSGAFGDALAAAMGSGEAGTRGVQVTGIVPDASPFKQVYEPGHPDADARGYVQMPNINTVTEMVDMMGATRAYEANVAAIAAVKAMAQKALEIGRA